ncbi:UNVERIFIED_CONTAM: Serine/arginine-rich splicing factor SC35 [Sesamum calycinum]|uniref:Serine/arginine-rich splicing factor SC35 n=1 Tax=Sesamum calycinum TaxID=2727403 RepID=A0AAW2QLM1_9LAMI
MSSDHLSASSNFKQAKTMSHFGRSGPPDIRDTYSLLVLNITFRTTADDLFPLFDKYGKVVDVFIPRDRRTGDSRGFAFVRYKYQDEAQKAVEKLDGKVVDGREIMVQFAKYGPNAERIHKGELKNPFTGPEEGHEAAVLDQGRICCFYATAVVAESCDLQHK